MMVGENRHVHSMVADFSMREYVIELITHMK